MRPRRRRTHPDASRGWSVVFAGTALNLALGVLYSWSLLAKAMKEPIINGGFGWETTQTQLPYAVACGMFAIMMVFAGRAQDKLGPRIVASIGGALPACWSADVYDKSSYQSAR